jgi:hypothetical protein
MSHVEDVARLKELEAKATPGPWSWYAEDHSMCWLGQTGNDQENFVLGSTACKSCAERHERCMQPQEKDSRLISDLRNAAPWMLAVAGQFQAGDATILGLFVAFMEHYKPDGHLNDVGPGKNITNAQATDCLRRMLAAAKVMECKS